MSDVIDAFIAEARAITLADYAGRIGRVPVRGSEWTGPCPTNRGTDGFAVNPGKGVWNCRKCGQGGHDAISLAAHEHGHDLRDRTGFLEACAAVLDRDIPDPAQRETDEERAAREERMADARAKAARQAEAHAEQQNQYRQKAVTKARGLYFNASIVTGAAGRVVRDYLRLRCGAEMDESVFDNIRFDDRHTFWHDEDEFGNPLSLHVGPAMIAPYVDLDGAVTGCHETWIDLGRAPKYRPLLTCPKKGRPLSAKKMQGAKKGSVIPVCGDLSARRWVLAEGIENVAAVAGLEFFRADTFYGAAGDIGNLCGPAEGRERHPTLTMTDKRGRARAVTIPGPLPKAGLAPGECLDVPDHVDDLVLVADGDSEPVETAFAMARAERRLSRPGRAVVTVWPPEGAGDFSELMMEGADA
ncbi:DUF7146 domain-containing protein [Martelella endophytica]|uniref:DUF7146 domain-containing protein n=1 Tax=Martelella endophytica TaxID=1486262 RepID=A0A0D5LLM8_MAREN|nr:hypothetical protein [Martelella endophytica]AJY44677.1 hypothetical protein TM49_01640 [Martelella endophytica]